MSLLCCIFHQYLLKSYRTNLGLSFSFGEGFTKFTYALSSYYIQFLARDLTNCLELVSRFLLSIQHYH